MNRLLAFHLGPVQDFIATARRTQDLWLGSWLLSHLSRTALQSAKDQDAELILPDAVPDANELTDAGTTNHFIVQAGAAQTQTIATACEQAVRDEWKYVADTTKRKFFRAVNDGLWTRQTENLLEIYWASVPDDGSPTARNQAQAALDARKRVRDFSFTAEDNLKCTLCGTRQEMSGQASYSAARDWWTALAQQFNGQLRVREDGSERLCAVCGIKRAALVAGALRVGGVTLNRQDGHFPSTSGAAAATWKHALLTGRKADAELGDYLSALQRLGFRDADRIDRDALPGLVASATATDTPVREWQDKLLRWDGDLFYAESFAEEKFKKEFPHIYSRLEAQARAAAQAEITKRGLANLNTAPGDNYTVDDLLDIEPDYISKRLPKEIQRQIQRHLASSVASLRTLCRTSGGRPSKYLAALKMDGDKMGAFFGKADAAQAQDLSQRVSAFASQGAKAIVHRNLGRLIYAGGDDVLALLPLDTALRCARELQEGFKQAVEGLIPPSGVELPTPSIGIAVAHHTAPLDLTLQALGHAEQAAKNHYGRDALAVYVLKHSGEEMRVGTHWTMTGEDGQAKSPVALVEKLVEWLRDDSVLSMKFAYSLAAEARALAAPALPVAARTAELKRLAKRHKGKDFQKDIHQAEVVAAMEQLARWADTKRPGEDGNEQPLGLEEVAKWVLLARFLAKGGSDE